MKFRLAAGVLLGFSASCFSQGRGSEVPDWIRDHQQSVLREYLQLVAVPNVHNDLPNLRRNAALLREMLDRRGLKPEVWETGGAPVVFGECRVPGATRTLLLYIHYDGQPVEGKRWAQLDPFTPVLRSDSIESGGQAVTEYAEFRKLPDE